ncbi:hypothetical protein [Thermomonospora amylolytica]|uniref:hypothetical protein n=1 Tax=Thermomonospora amylolytica TaxID=1411117 RepID=UPI000E6C2A0E|nr:hypothetical protein [Thermomonospora amylolytica]
MLLEGAEQIEELRRTWDPVMADLVPAHLTVTYPEETTDEALLLRRAESWLPQATAFRLRPGKVFAENEGHGGVVGGGGFHGVFTGGRQNARSAGGRRGGGEPALDRR